MYEHYQQRLKVAETEINGKDLLVAFLKEYKEELDEFEKEEDEAGGFAATLGSLNASMHLEAEAAAFNQPTRTYRPLKERPSILAALNASMHQVTESFNTTLHDHTLAGEAEESASHQSQNHSTRSDGFSERWKRVSTLFSASLEKDATGYPDGSDSERPLHRSRPIQFDPIIEENDDDDPFLNQASDIALRRRNGKGGPKTTLVSIEDMGEEDLEGSFVNVEVKDGEELTDPAEASSRDPMMEGTQHNDPRSGQPSNSGRDFNDHVLEKVTNKSPVAECDSRTKVVMNHVNDSKGRAVDEKESVDIENDGNSNSEDSLI